THDGSYVEVELPFFVGQVGAAEPLVRAEPRVVDQDIDGPVGIGQPSGYPRAAIVRDEVSRHDLDVDTVLILQCIAGRGEALGIPSDENEISTLGRQRPRERGAEAGRRTGDERGTQRNTPMSRRARAIIGRGTCRGFGLLRRSSASARWAMPARRIPSMRAWSWPSSAGRAASDWLVEPAEWVPAWLA